MKKPTLTVGEEVLIILGSYSRGYHLLRKNLGGQTGSISFKNLRSISGSNPETLRITLSRLKQNGLVTNKNLIWAIKEKGRRYLEKRIKKFKYKNCNKKSLKSNMIIAFDVPERDAIKRHWLRKNLEFLGFSKLQNSVWIGPAPLPKEFIEYLEEMRLLPYIKFFKAAEHEIV